MTRLVRVGLAVAVAFLALPLLGYDFQGTGSGWESFTGTGDLLVGSGGWISALPSDATLLLSTTGTSGFTTFVVYSAGHGILFSNASSDTIPVPAGKDLVWHFKSAPDSIRNLALATGSTGYTVGIGR